ncbi:hypothetical protein M0R19_04620 [Candidatus Pacearchaeota archaeon]|jgi:hypothetical protein|nr:hypothetical protein [Candidatus Pacearchaeota archaeon]
MSAMVLFFIPKKLLNHKVRDDLVNNAIEESEKLRILVADASEELKVKIGKTKKQVAILNGHSKKSIAHLD